MRQQILVIEDEAAIADTIVYALETDGFEAVWVATGSEGRELLRKNAIALIILDIGLPDMSGIEFCKEIRQDSSVPIIFLTARNDEIDRVVGLEIGGDDYIAKPFSPRELTARVKAVLRRYQTVPTPSTPLPKPVPTTSSDDTPFLLDETRMSISYFDVPLDLTKCEFRLLQTLIRHPGRVYSRESLKEIAWDEPEFSLDRTVDTHIKTIRGKLRAVRPDRDPIETRRGFGYALRESW
ncbi:MAG: two-component system response regulator CreB [Chitinispirillaceae bacterium]|nr:two-component system response regulator CreB [Chitinispirillaceae bacterium]